MVTEEEFDAFYRSGYRRVVGQVYAMVGDLREAEDAVQEAYCRAWLRRKALAGGRRRGGHGEVAAFSGPSRARRPVQFQEFAPARGVRGAVRGEEVCDA